MRKGKKAGAWKWERKGQMALLRVRVGWKKCLWRPVPEMLNFKFELMLLVSRNDFIDSTLVGCSELGYWRWMICSSFLTSKLFDPFLVESESYLKNFISAAHTLSPSCYLVNQFHYKNVYISRPTRSINSYNESLLIIKCSTYFGLCSPSSGATFWSCISQLV